MITLKIAYKTEEQNLKFIQDLQRQYTICLKVIYKYTKQGLSKKQTKELLLNYNNIDFMLGNSWFMASLFYDVKPLLQFDNVCFKKTYLYKRDRNIISKDKWKIKKNLPICSLGDTRVHSNRFFQFTDINNLLFKPDKQHHINLQLRNIGKNRISDINKLIEIQKNCFAPICYKLDSEYVYISFDETLLEKQEHRFISNRIFAIDLNTNYIGYSILDWISTEKLDFNIVKTSVIAFDEINKKHFQYNKIHLPSTDKRRKHLNNKRDHELLEASKHLVNLAKHYKCEIFTVEDLSIKSKDIGKGRRYNTYCNNIWCKNIIIHNIIKRCNQQGIKIQKIQPQYSSILGNLLFRKLDLPDMVLASIEISRRCQEFNLQYLKKIKTIKKNVIYPELNNKIKLLLHQSMEELEVADISYDLDNLQSIFKYIKNHEIKYRVPLEIMSCKASQLRFKKHDFTCFNKL